MGFDIMMLKPRGYLSSHQLGTVFSLERDQGTMLCKLTETWSQF
jgi:hypothetical protein